MVLHYKMVNSVQNEGAGITMTGPTGLRSRIRRAFTLIELLIVIAIIAILAAMLLPVLEKAESRAQEIQCINNLHELMLGWHMYADDNREYPPNEDYNAVPRWVAGDMRGGTITPLPGAPVYPGIDATNTLLLIDPHYSCMGPYVSQPKIFKCPADLSTWSTGGGAGRNELPRVRSYSMSQAIGPCENGTLVGSDVMGHWLSGGNSSAPGGFPWKVFTKDSQIVGMSPSDLFVLDEEHPNSINDAACAEVMPLNAAATYFIDTPSKTHENSSGVFSFADCHAEMRHWINAATIGPIIWEADSPNAPSLGGSARLIAADPDIIWFAHHVSCLASGAPANTFQP